MRRPIISLVLGLGLVAASQACKQKVQTVDASQSEGFRKGERRVETGADALPGGGGKSSGGGTGGGPAGTNGPGAGATNDAPQSYLLSSNDADKLRPIVEKYRDPEFQDTPGTYTQNFEKYRRFTEDFLNRAMGLQALLPGRHIVVHIAEDQQVNAFAGAFQDVTINSGTISAADNMQLLAVLCHELGHSARNHSMKSVDFQTTTDIANDLAKFYDGREAFLKKQFDEAAGTYTHDARAYAEVAKAWRGVEPRLSKFTKRQESEADIIGAEICGHAGMPTDTYVESLSGFLSTGDAVDAQNGGDAKTAAQLGDGEKFQLDKDYLIAYLFPQDSHPSNGERREQLLRLKGVVSDHFDQTARLFTDWKQNYQGAAQGLGLTGRSLADALAGNVKVIKTESGKTIRIKRKHLCGGQHAGH